MDRHGGDATPPTPLVDELGQVDHPVAVSTQDEMVGPGRADVAGMRGETLPAGLGEPIAHLGLARVDLHDAAGALITQLDQTDIWQLEFARIHDFDDECFVSEPDCPQRLCPSRPKKIGDDHRQPAPTGWAGEPMKTFGQRS